MPTYVEKTFLVIATELSWQNLCSFVGSFETDIPHARKSVYLRENYDRMSVSYCPICKDVRVSLSQLCGKSVYLRKL